MRGQRGDRRRDGGLPRLSAVDASNLTFEHDGSAYTIGLVGMLDAAPLVGDDGEPDIERLRRLLAPRVAAIGQLNRRVHATRWGQGLPVWVDAPADVVHHVHRGPRLDDRAAVDAWCGRLMSEPLPRDRPLWDLIVCAGPPPDLVTAVLRLHHALADGVAGVRLMQALFDGDQSTDDHPPKDDRPPRPAASPQLGRPPTGDELVRDAWATRLHALKTLPTRWRLLPRRLPAAARTLATGVVRTAAVVRGGLPPTSLLGPVGSQRGVSLLTADLQTLRTAARAGGCTVNDVLLNAVAGATAALLTDRGESLPGVVPVSVPVSLRAPDETATTANRVGVMLAPLPLTVTDPQERLRRIAAVTRRAKAEARRAGTFELTRSRLGTRLFDVLSRHQHTVGLFVTNVPGPPRRLHLGGAALRQAWPLSTLGGNVRLAVAALSYAGTLHVTVTSDLASSPDAAVFAGALRAGLSAEADM